MMNKYQRLIKALEETGTGEMKCFGNSMVPRIKSGAINTYMKKEYYGVHDIVFCKVNGRYIDAHWIKAVGARGYLIGNNHGLRNGWTHTVYGKVVSTRYEN